MNSEDILSQIESSCKNLLSEGVSLEEVLASIRYYTVQVIEKLQDDYNELYFEVEEVRDQEFKIDYLTEENTRLSDKVECLEEDIIELNNYRIKLQNLLVDYIGHDNLPNGPKSRTGLFQTKNTVK